jgi:hypothetical protein
MLESANTRRVANNRGTNGSCVLEFGCGTFYAVLRDEPA